MNRYQTILGQTYAAGEFEHIATDKAAAKCGDPLFDLLWNELDEDNIMVINRRLDKVKEQVDEVMREIWFDLYSRTIEPMTKSEAWDYMANNIHMDDPLWSRLKEIIRCKPT
ncbi:hypothetical protein CPT_Seuss91 [Caulobacter phage Seuss]|uniref:Uncharacterized protein n=1 Tax=Caulobacter phage Seuss TaxID=1675601 RepID=A0A0K1LM72_9CAUD|nr:hypothetical protein HOR08_gp091 [Caulobacter phage Seuss]AKU43617.1 hypothetical protein CPT_Seuss91 [Caulobacter phage Seuss]